MPTGPQPPATRTHSHCHSVWGRSQYEGLVARPRTDQWPSSGRTRSSARGRCARATRRGWAVRSGRRQPGRGSGCPDAREVESPRDDQGHIVDQAIRSVRAGALGVPPEPGPLALEGRPIGGGQQGREQGARLRGILVPDHRERGRGKRGAQVMDPDHAAVSMGDAALLHHADTVRGGGGRNVNPHHSDSGTPANSSGGEPGLCQGTPLGGGRAGSRMRARSGILSGSYTQCDAAGGGR